MLDWSFIKQNTFKLLKFMDINITINDSVQKVIKKRV